MTALVSVCIPVRNGEAHLADTLRSVLEQDVDGLEVVVSDNASSDRTVELVRSMRDSRVRLLTNDRDVGGIANWNLVAAAASGLYLKLLAADDLLYSGSLARQLAVLRDPANAGVALVASQRDIVDGEGRLLLRGRGLGSLSGRVAAADAVRATVRSGTNLFGEPHVALFRRSALPSDGAFRAEASYMVDLDLWCRLLAGGDLYALRTTVGAFRVHTGAESVRVAAEQTRHAARLFRELERDGRVGRGDVLLGVARAHALAAARRSMYGGLRWRGAIGRWRASRPSPAAVLGASGRKTP